MDSSLYQFLESGDTVLCASQRLAHRLRLDYAALAQQGGKVVWPTPNIATLNNYLIDAFKLLRQSHARLPQLLNEMQTQWIWESIVQHDDSHSLLSPAQAARSAIRSWNVLHQYRIPLSKFSEYNSEEAQVFQRWAKAFTAYADSHNVIDVARLIAWIESSNFVPLSAIHLAGFDQFTPAQQALIEHWKRQKCDVHALDAPAINRGVQVISANDADDELQSAARWARAQLECGRQRIGIIVPDLNVNAAQVRRIFNGVLAPASRSALHDYTSTLSISSSAVLTSYPMIHHALLSMQLLIEHGDVLAWGQLLRSPFFAGYELEQAARALLDVQFRKLNREQWSADEVARLGVTTCPEFSAAVHAAEMVLSASTDKALPSEWVGCFNRILIAVGWGHGRTLSSDEQQIRNKFYEVLAHLSTLDDLTDRVSGIAALQLLRNALQQTRFAPESVEQAITVTDEDSAAGMQFDALWVAGLHADLWPRSPDPDAFIPITLQYQYDVATSRPDLCWISAKRKLQRLVDCADDVVLSSPLRDKDMELRASAFLDHYRSTASTSTTSTIGVPRSNIKTLVQTLFQHKPLLETVTDVQLPPHPGGVIKQGSRVLELQSRCAFKAQAELRLHAVAPDAPVIGVSPFDRGKLIHRILQEIWNRLHDSNGLQMALQNEEGLREELLQTANRIAQSLISTVTTQQQRLMHIEVQVAIDLIVLLLKHENRRDDFSVMRSEQLEVMHVNGLKLKIQPDRIDQLKDGSLLLIDYKTSKNYHAKDWLDTVQSGRPRAPQLPLYALAHSEKLCGIAYAILAPGVAELRGLADRDDIAANIKNYGNRRTSSKLPNVTDWSQLLDHWQRVMNDLATQFKQGMAMVNPLPYECDYCALTSLCRVKDMADKDESDEDGDDE